MSTDDLVNTIYHLETVIKEFVVLTG